MLTQLGDEVVEAAVRSPLAHESWCLHKHVYVHAHDDWHRFLELHQHAASMLPAS